LRKKFKRASYPPPHTHTLRSYDVLIVIFQEEQEEEKLATTPNETSHKKRTTPSGKLNLNPTLPNFVVAKKVGKDRK
jgi:hypothetical protein